MDESKKYYRRAIEINPNYTRATYNLGTLFEQQNKYSDALKEFDNLLNQDPTNIAARYKLASVFLSLDHYNKAIEHFNKILDTESEHIPTLRSLARAYLKTGEKEKATECYNRLIQIDSENKDFHLDIAYIMKEKKNYKQAEKEVNTYLKANPEDLRGRILLGDIYDLQGHTKHAIQVFKDTIDIYPDNSESYYCLARLHRKNNDQLKAIETFEELITLQKTRGSHNDLNQLKDSLDLYESTVQDYEKQHKDEWLKNIKKLTEPIPIKYETNGNAEQTTGLDELLQVEEESVPILNIGGLEPIFAVKEEEEYIKIEEDDEDIPQIEEHPEFTKEEIKSEEEYNKDDIQNLIDDSLLPLSHMLKKLVKKEESELTEPQQRKQQSEQQIEPHQREPEYEKQPKPVRMEALPEQLAQQPVQIINYPNSMDPGVVNSLKDTVVEQKKLLEIIQHEVSRAFKLLTNQKKTIPIKISPPIKIVRAPAQKEDGTEDLNQYKVEYENDTELQEEPAALKKEEKKSNISGLFDYLKNLTSYLPEQKKESISMKDMVLKMEYLSNKLSGNPGLKKKIESKYIHVKEPEIKAPVNTRKSLTKKIVSATFEKLKKYSKYLPNKKIGKALTDKLDSLISKILSPKN